jgi:hypothetical protein
VNGTCGQPQGGKGDCCAVHAGTGCTVSAISTCVCAQDSYCCSSGWDTMCVNEVASFNCSTCP